MPRETNPVLAKTTAKTGRLRLIGDFSFSDFPTHYQIVIEHVLKSHFGILKLKHVSLE